MASLNFKMGAGGAAKPENTETLGAFQGLQRMINTAYLALIPGSSRGKLIVVDGALGPRTYAALSEINALLNRPNITPPNIEGVATNARQIAVALGVALGGRQPDFTPTPRDQPAPTAPVPSPGPVPPAVVVVPPGPPPKKRSWGPIILATAMAGGAIGLGYYLWKRRQGEPVTSTRQTRSRSRRQTRATVNVRRRRLAA